MSRRPRVAVILAAGLGRRLAPLTDTAPKALVAVDGRTLLERSLAALASASFQEVIIVTGHREELVREFVASRPWATRVTCRFNPRFDTANNVVSLLTAAEGVTGAFCLLNSDTLFDPEILVELAERPGGSWLVVDHDEPLGEEEMKVQLDPDGFVRRISKTLAPEASHGEYIGLARFDAAAAATVVDSARRLVAEGRTELYYEDAIDQVAIDLELCSHPVGGRAWTEVDDLQDFERALAVAAAIDGEGSP